jgi:cyanophycinase
LTNAVIDQHFIKRKRLNRLFSIALEHPDLVGIGIDESTAIVVNPDDTFEVIGESAVMVIDPRKASGIRTDKSGNLSARNIRTHILVAGDRFDLMIGKTINSDD